MSEEPTIDELIRTHDKQSEGARKALEYSEPRPNGESSAQLRWKAKFYGQTAQALRDLQAERDRLRNKLSYFYECQQCGDLLRESEVGGIGDHTRFTVDLNGEPAREQCGPCFPVEDATANARKEGSR